MAGSSKDNLFNVIKRPRISEKSTRLSESNVYCFDVLVSANKPLVAQAIKALYGVTPRKVTFAKIPTKKVGGRGRPAGRTARGKKAFVFLKKGDKIDFV